MTLFEGPLSYQEDNWFSFSLNFILAQFKFIPTEFKYRRYAMVKNPFLYTRVILKGSTICPMSEIVCFPVLNFTYSHVENSLFFALDFAISL
jgi:hypothetical protein